MPDESVSREPERPAQGPRPGTLTAAAVGSFALAVLTAGYVISGMTRSAGRGTSFLALVAWSLGGLFALYFAWTGRQLLRRDKAAYLLFRALVMLNFLGTLVWVVRMIWTVALGLEFPRLAPGPASLNVYAPLASTLLTSVLVYLLNAPPTRISVGEKPTGGSPVTFYVSPKVFLLMLALALGVVIAVSV